MNAEDLLAYGSVSAIGRELRARTLSTREAVAWYLARIEAFNRAGPGFERSAHDQSPRLADAQHADDELARGDDRGPLHGIPVLLKDNILTADGMPHRPAPPRLPTSCRNARRRSCAACVRPAPSCSARPT